MIITLMKRKAVPAETPPIRAKFGAVYPTGIWVEGEIESGDGGDWGVAWGEDISTGHSGSSNAKITTGHASPETRSVSPCIVTVLCDVFQSSTKETSSVVFQVWYATMDALNVTWFGLLSKHINLDWWMWVLGKSHSHWSLMYSKSWWINLIILSFVALIFHSLQYEVTWRRNWTVWENNCKQ